MVKLRVLFLITVLVLSSACSKNESEVTGGRGPLVRDMPPPPEEIDEIEKKAHPPQAVGFYAQGKIINDFFFPLEGEGFLKVFRARNRNFSTNHLYDILAYAAAEVAKAFPGGERLQIGDISKVGGGRLSLHASHQNGLDADLAYYRVNRREMNPEGFGAFDEVFVKNGKVTPNFDLERNYEFMKILVSTGVINRLFVDAAIKMKYCELSQGQKLSALDLETIRRMRTIENHKDHIHVRVKCPSTSPDCQTQEEPPAGTGCPARGKMLFNMFDPSET